MIRSIFHIKEVVKVSALSCLMLPGFALAQTQSFKNPLSFTSITGLMSAILNVAIVIATPIVVFFLIYAGFMYVTARGNAEKVQQASRALLFGVIGGVIVIGAVAILAIMQDVVSNF